MRGRGRRKRWRQHDEIDDKLTRKQRLTKPPARAARSRPRRGRLAPVHAAMLGTARRPPPTRILAGHYIRRPGIGSLLHLCVCSRRQRVVIWRTVRFCSCAPAWRQCTMSGRHAITAIALVVSLSRPRSLWISAFRRVHTLRTPASNVSALSGRSGPPGKHAMGAILCSNVMII